MKLFIYEHITSGALAGQSLPTSLAEEGDAMLTAIVQDLSEVSQLEIILLRDSRLKPLVQNAENISLHYHWITDSKQFSHLWSQCLKETEATVAIVPETDKQLTCIQQDILDHANVYFGCSQHSTILCSDKLLCYQHLSNHNIPTPKTYHATQWILKDLQTTQKYIIKPIDGAGCLDTLLVDNVDDAKLYLNTLPSEKLAMQIVQPYIEGKAISLSLFISNNVAQLLTINKQNIDYAQQHLVFINCSVNNVAESEFSRSDAQQIADQLYHAIPGLWGFVGVDLVLSSVGAVIIEINPRLTTSYIGLKEALNFNPATLLIENMPEIINRKPAQR